MGEARVNPERPSPSFEPPETLNGSLGTTGDYLTDKVRSAAAEAIAGHDFDVDVPSWSLRCKGCDWSEQGGLPELHDEHLVHLALAAVLPDIIRQAKVEALAEGDGYHTHEELYEYRMLYNAHAARGWLAASIPVVKSWRHSDGALCFGGGWFVVTATLPSGQVSNHYKAEFWGLFDVPEVDLAPEYDGHTPEEAADRLRAHLIEQGGQP